MNFEKFLRKNTSGGCFCWFEPSFCITSVTNGTAFSVGHFSAATVYNGGPATNIFSS